MRLTCPTPRELNEAAEKIYDAAFYNYIAPSRYDKQYNPHNFEKFPFGGGNKNKSIQRIKELLKRGNDVLNCGYMATSIREYHERFIIWKP